MRIVSVMNYKGGVGKTTIAANIGAGLAARGQKVLLLDLDPQASLTYSFFPEWDLAERGRGIMEWFDASETSPAPPSLSELVRAPERVNEIVRPSGGQVDVLTSDLSLLELDMRLAARLSVEDPGKARVSRIKTMRILADAFEEEAFATYDNILIDCAPDFGILTRMAMVASDFVLIPAKAEPLSTIGIGYLLQNLDRLVTEYQALSPSIAPIKPEVLGVIFNMIQLYSGQPIYSQQASINQLASTLNAPIFRATIRNASRAAISPSLSGIPAVLDDTGSSELAYDFHALTDELLQRMESG